MTRLSFLKLGGAEVLAGALSGQALFRALLDHTPSKPTAPQIVFLDMDGVAVATSSLLRESVLAYREHLRRHRPLLYPVVANANAAVDEELEAVLDALGAGALIACTLASDGSVTNPRLVGKLDPKQDVTYQQVLARGETDARELEREQQDRVSVTAWNNRLAALAALGVVVEVNHGRAKRYRPVLAGAA